MACRIFQLCVVLAVVEIFHHADCTSLSSSSPSIADNLIKPPPSRLTSLPIPLELSSVNTQPPSPRSESSNAIWAIRNTQVEIPCLIRWSTAADKRNDDRSPVVRWLRDRQTVNGSSITYSKGAQASLRVLATGGAEGSYECLVEYGGGDGAVLSNPVQLRIANMHEFTANPEDIVAEEGQPAALFCNINSNPPANITWLKNNLALINALSSDSYVILPSNTLLIKRVHSSDGGTYRCRATNTILKKSRLSKRAKLRLQPKTSALRDAEILATALETNKTAFYGNDLDLYCFARGSPEPNIQWYKDGILVGENNILGILNLTEEHSGNYKCIAANNISTSYLYYTLSVLRPPYFNITPESMSFPSAKTVRLFCDVNGNPKPKISWLKNGRKLEYDGRVKLLQNTLVLSHSFSTDAGIYQCVAENIVGRIWSAARLSITMPFGQPQPPQNVTCRPYEANSICVQWRAPHDLNASAYSVHTTDMQTTKMLTEQVTNDTNMLVRQLRPNSTYAFYVRGYVRSASDQSNSVHCTTLLGASLLRRRFTVEVANETSAWLTWQGLSNDIPCTSNGAGIEEGEDDVWYRLQWRHISTSPSIYHTTFTRGGRYHLTSLIPSTIKQPSRYLLHVEPLASPPDKTTLNTIIYTTSPPTPSVNSFANHKHPAFEYTMPSITSADNDNIITTVYDENELDEEELSEDDEDDEESDDDDDDVFLPPYGLSAALSGHDSVLLTWQDDNAGVKFYTVCYAPLVMEGDSLGGGCGSGSLYKYQEFKKCTTKSVQVNNLHQNTLYEFRVRAHAIDDITSIYSDPIQLNTMDLLSSAVQNLDYFIINASCVCVTWQEPPYLQNSSYTNYTVAYSIKQKKKSEDGWHYITVISGPGVKQHSCYRTDDSTTNLPLGKPVIATRRSSEMSLILSELKPNLNYSLFVQSPSSNPGVTITITISTRNTTGATNINKEYEYSSDDDLTQMERTEHTRREQILGAIVGVCVSVPLLLAVICWFKIWPWWRRRRDERVQRRQNMSHLNGGTTTAALTAKSRPQNHNEQNNSISHSNRHEEHYTNNNGGVNGGVATSATYIVGNGGIDMRTKLRRGVQHGRSERGIEDGGVEMQRLLGSPQPLLPCGNIAKKGEEMRKSTAESLPKNGLLGYMHITENPQYASNGVFIVDSLPSEDNRLNGNTNNCRRQLLSDSITDTTQIIQLLPRRQSPALAPNG